ncbi:MAG: hypothetical protein EOM20_01955 [Spartobacteria bacterium]|nr:hypothetical protein [Spartobacteria bacterium]
MNISTPYLVEVEWTPSFLAVFAGGHKRPGYEAVLANGSVLSVFQAHDLFDAGLQQEISLP